MSIAPPLLRPAASAAWPCDTCGAPALAVAPGEAEIREVFLLRRERAQRTWCEACWLRTFGAWMEEREATA